MIESLWPEANGPDRPLPRPNVVVPKSGTPLNEMTPESVKGILVNPIYAGVGPYSQMVKDAAWVRACTKLIEEDGPEQFLVNLLYVLRESFDMELLRGICGSDSSEQ